MPTIAILVAFYLTEICFRIFYHVPDLVASYYPLGNEVSGAKIHVVQREYSVDMMFNNQGFLDKEFSFENKTPNEKRILFLGDSFVEGHGVSVERRASSIVEKRIIGNNPEYKVINAAQLATNPISYFENLARFGVALKPDIVVVGIFIGNDFMDSRAHPVPQNYVVYEERPGLKNNAVGDVVELGYVRFFIGSLLHRNARLVRNVRTDKFWDFYFKEKISPEFFVRKAGLTQAEFEKRIASFQKDIASDFFTGKLNPSYLINSLSLKRNDVENKFYVQSDVDNVVDIINEMKFICETRKIKFIVVLYPDIYAVAPEIYKNHLIDNFRMPFVPSIFHELVELKTKFVSHLVQHNICMIDLTDVLSDKDYYLFDGHLNYQGQATAGEIIYQRITNEL